MPPLAERSCYALTVITGGEREMKEKKEGRHKDLSHFFVELLGLWQIFLSLVVFHASLPVFPIIDTLI